MTRAQQAAWDIYIRRINAIVREQHAAFEKGWPIRQLLMAPPTQEHVEAIEAAMADAQREIVGAALDPFVSACDAIDNSRSKAPVIAEIREVLERGYQRLHKLKESPQTTDAVDPVVR